ncbi:MAG: hypothetical protein EXQ52_17675 [Bryobacterales bacterium]|nr:hypothetical protein [Bryobacterales bacterium]
MSPILDPRGRDSGRGMFAHEDFALRKIPAASFAANVLYLEIVRLADNLVTAFQRICLGESWQSLALQRLRYKLFLIPGELTRPQNRPPAKAEAVANVRGPRPDGL